MILKHSFHLKSQFSIRKKAITISSYYISIYLIINKLYVL